jgi:hypothetical protein
VGGVVPRIARTANENSLEAGEIEIEGLAVVPLAVVPPAVGFDVATPFSRIVAQTWCALPPPESVAVIVCAPPGIAPW